jgi:hypothetical protein
MITSPEPEPWDELAEMPRDIPVIEMIPSEDRVSVGVADRETLLQIASHLTTCREDAAAVVINAIALLSCAELAVSIDDLRLRMDLLQRHDMNLQARQGEGVEMIKDAPAHFLAGAEVLDLFKIEGGTR